MDSKMIENNIQQSIWAHTIAFHDFEMPSPEMIQGWFESMEKLFQGYGLIPNRIALTYFEKKSGSKSITFKIGKKRLYDQNFNDIQSIHMMAMPPDYGTESFDDLLSAYLSLYKTNKKNTFILMMDGEVVPLDSQVVIELIKKSAIFLNPRYGYIFKRRFRHGPLGYPVGIGSGSDRKNPVPEEERNLISKWSDHIRMPDGEYKTGDLRDIYPCNILSQPHMDHMIEGMLFQDWISQKSHRGVLIPIRKKLWTWWVEEEHIPIVREELRNTGFLICV